MSDIALPIHGASGLPLAGRLLSDERLAKLAGRGDARAFTTLYERYHQAIYRYCRSIVRNDHDAQDALQSAMVRAYTALCASERDLSVRPWLFRIAHNEAISILRRRPQEDQLVDVHESLDSDVERTAEERERLSMLLADLQALPERQRAALLMRELSGLSIEEIAGALSVSTGAAKQTLFEARSSLHEFAKGRAMECEAVRRAISEHDGRVLRGRGLRAHLRDCSSCRDFRALIETRGADLRALAPPLPAILASATLTRLLARGGGGHTAGAGATAGSALGGHVAASLVVKGLAGVAVLAAATAGTLRLTAGNGGNAHRSPNAISASGRNHARSSDTEMLVSSGAAAKRAARARSSTSSISTGASTRGRSSAVSGSIAGPEAAPGRAPASGGTRSGSGHAPGLSHGAKTVGSHGTGSNAPHRTASRGQRHAHGGSSPKPSAHARHHATKPAHPSSSPQPQGSHGGNPTEPSGANGKGAGQGARAPQPHEAPDEAQADGSSSGAGRAGAARGQTLTPGPPPAKQVER
ncbi:MAG TPA: sigma-70 family RNA polymerase sigma factor [Solirubrobacteraceae bacterium]|jgi:RNA polymerase sigma factor (sigma-70 family)|nr:sigma-70 family RNA polymerase sigma factor [Solirubrobacteraceae bacterium]